MSAVSIKPFLPHTADVTDPITSGRILLYRFNLAYENDGSFRDFIDTARIFVPPVVTWNLLAFYAHTGERNEHPCSRVYTDANGREYIDSQLSRGRPRRWPPHNPWRCGRSARGVLP
jgi:hypothetical protein